MHSRAGYAALLRAGCDMGVNCTCAKQVEAGGPHPEEDGFFSDDFPGFEENQYVIVVGKSLSSLRLKEVLDLDLILQQDDDERDLYGSFDSERGIDLHLGAGHSVLSEAEAVVATFNHMPDASCVEGVQRTPSQSAFIPKQQRGHVDFGAKITGFNPRQAWGGPKARAGVGLSKRNNGG